jgi:hypothetical protein
MSLPSNITKPRYIEQVDQVHLTWSPPLTDDAPVSLEDKTTAAREALVENVYPFWETWVKPGNKKLVLSVAYPSVEGGTMQCLEVEGDTCFPPSSLNKPAPDLPDLPTNFQEQTQAYQANLVAISDQDWISGLISRGYYAPVVLHDASISIHGKPAAEVIKNWFETLTP